MLCQVEGTELCFVVEHVEILIKLIVVDKLSTDLILAVREGAEVPVLTLFHVVREVRAELLLVSLVLIELLYS